MPYENLICATTDIQTNLSRNNTKILNRRADLISIMPYENLICTTTNIQTNLTRNNKNIESSCRSNLHHAIRKFDLHNDQYSDKSNQK